MDTSGDRSVGEERSESARTRRRWRREEKLRIVQETFEPGVSIAVVARRHCVNANQLFTWRTQYRRGELVCGTDGERTVKLLAVQVEQPAVSTPAVTLPSESGSEPVGCMEIQVSGGRHVKVWGQIDPKALRVLVRELLRSC